jgi:hypothetical protein
LFVQLEEEGCCALVFFSFLLFSEVDAAMPMLARSLLMECDALDG